MLRLMFDYRTSWLSNNSMKELLYYSPRKYSPMYEPKWVLLINGKSNYWETPLTQGWCNIKYSALGPVPCTEARIYGVPHIYCNLFHFFLQKSIWYFETKSVIFHSKEVPKIPACWFCQVWNISVTTSRIHFIFGNYENTISEFKKACKFISYVIFIYYMRIEHL